MVWNQYVWEATTGNEADVSDDEYEAQFQQPVHIDDWIDFNSEELSYLWSIIQEYSYDACSNLLQYMTNEDLARFCYDPPLYFEGDFNTAYWIDTHSEELRYIWKLLRKTKCRLLYQTTYDEFAYFCYMST